MIQKNNLFKPVGDHYNPIWIGNAFSSNYIEYKRNVDKDKSLSIKEYLNMIKPHLSGIINDYKTQDKWKIHLIMAINIFPSKDSEETRAMDSKSDNIEVMMDSEMDEILQELFDSFLQRYKKNLEESMRGSEFIFDSVNSLYYKLDTVNLNYGGSYMAKIKKATINPKNNCDKFERISNINPLLINMIRNK